MFRSFKRGPYRRGPEESEMIAFFDYCRLKANDHPAYNLAFHIPNESKSSIQRRISLKRAGLKKGIPDICIPIAACGYHSLWIEMKVKPNRPSTEQKELIKELNANGHYASICWSAYEAIKLLEDYIGDKLCRG
jgi:hypothetical protein